MSTFYKIELRTLSMNRLVRVDDMTRYTEITKFHKDDLPLARKLCEELNKATQKG